MAYKMKGVFKGLKVISQIFVVKEHQMEIGYPTDVKHVAHIGWDSPTGSAASPSWILTSLEIYHPLVYFPKVAVKKQPSTQTYQSHPGSREGRNPRMTRQGHPRDPQGRQDQGPKAHFHLPLTVSVSRICNRKSRLYRPFLLTLPRR
ncbi:unnamed protein product [Miscanthus lutarioriparius]|uniref:CRIB domain-containing protein n=1 Tax=Miscanthus lutarioriparius TaxID=422564 RepID=A0A811PHR2_9POAL|nr:unnamed protein product [Miscanthus lutarioriparius]